MAHFSHSWAKFDTKRLRFGENNAKFAKIDEKWRFLRKIAVDFGNWRKMLTKSVN